MKNKQCPACGHWTYRTHLGEYVQCEICGKDGYGLKKISPDMSECSHCGFSYQEHIKINELKEAKKWAKKKSPREGRK